MDHKILALDFESFYSDEFSLRKMTPPEYILDPRWETIGCAVKEVGSGQPSVWVDGPDFGEWLWDNYDPVRTTTVTFNALFDNCVLAWRYGFVPSRMYCAMRMAAALWGHTLSSISLASVSRYLKLPPKGDDIVAAKGMRRADLMNNPAQWQAYQAYANRDNENNEGIFLRAWKEFPAQERRIMDRVLRCAVEPKFQIDVDMLRQHLVDVEKQRVASLMLAGCPSESEDDIEAFAKVLRSNPKFEELLTSRGVDIGYKPSATDPERQIPAFAKTDEFMSNLQEHDDPVVQALACARLGLRSTIEASRGARFMSIAALPWENHYRDGNGRFWSQSSMPIPLKYAGAHTHRLSGDWELNPQNLPSSRQPLSKLRKSLVAPPGYKVVVADKAQIECRVNALLCGQEDLLEIFRKEGDPYGVLACAIFEILGAPVPAADKATWKAWKKAFSLAHPTERFIGKSGVLGLGFMCGPPKFYNMVVRSARILGMDIPKLLEVWTPDLAAKSVRAYRATNGNIVQTWGVLNDILWTAWLGISGPVKFGPCVISKGCVEGPGGLKMQYGNPRTEGHDQYGPQLRYDYGRRSYKIYSGLFLENIVQFVARIITMNDALRIGDRTGINFSLQSHDELAFIVPEQDAQEHLRVCIEEMSRSPSWAPTMPMGAEGNIGQSYGEAK